MALTTIWCSPTAADAVAVTLTTLGFVLAIDNLLPTRWLDEGAVQIQPPPLHDVLRQAAQFVEASVLRQGKRLHRHPGGARRGIRLT